MIFKYNTLEILSKIIKNQTYDWILVSYILELLKKAFFSKQSKSSNQPKQKKNLGTDTNDNYFKNPDNLKKNSDLLINFFKIAINTLNMEEKINGEIIIAVISYIYKNIDESIAIQVDIF